VYTKDGIIANDETQGWDGKINGNALQSDVFVYVFSITKGNGSIKYLKGNITIIK
jgi:hypothetical protein